MTFDVNFCWIDEPAQSFIQAEPFIVDVGIDTGLTIDLMPYTIRDLTVADCGEIVYDISLSDPSKGSLALSGTTISFTLTDTSYTGPLTVNVSVRFDSVADVVYGFTFDIQIVNCLA